MRIVVDHEKCQGHGRCYDLAPEVFRADDDVVIDVDEPPTLPPAGEASPADGTRAAVSDR